MKLEASFPVKEIISIDRVTRQDAEASLKRNHDVSRNAGWFSKAMRKLVTKVTLSDGSIFFMETMDHKKFKEMIETFQKEER